MSKSNQQPPTRQQQYATTPLPQYYAQAGCAPVHCTQVNPCVELFARFCSAPEMSSNVRELTRRSNILLRRPGIARQLSEINSLVQIYVTPLLQRLTSVVEGHYNSDFRPIYEEDLDFSLDNIQLFRHAVVKRVLEPLISLNVYDSPARDQIFESIKMYLRQIDAILEEKTTGYRQFSGSGRSYPYV